MYGYKRTDLRFSPVAWLKCMMLERLPVGNKHYGSMSVDKLERSSLSDDIQGYKNLYDLGVSPSKVVDKMPFELVNHQAFGYYIPDTLEEEPEVPDPIPLKRWEVKEVIKQNKTGLLESVGLN